MTCTKCNEEVIPNQSLCSLHFKEYWEDIWGDNSDIDNLGIIRWNTYFLPEYARDTTPKFHKEAYLLLFQLLDPFYRNKLERQIQFIWFREASKSGVLAMFTLFLMTHNGKKVWIKGMQGERKQVKIEEKLIAIISETGGSAEEFVVRLRDEFPQNQKFKFFYPYSFEQVEFDDQWTRKAKSIDEWKKRSFRYNGCAVVGLGAKQQIRGKVKGAYRITTAIFDDIYSENSVKTEETRRGTRIWFNRSALNSVDSLLGKIIAVNTIVHEDTVTVDNMRNPQWKNIFVPVMSLEKFEKFVKEHLTTDKLTGRVDLKFQNIKDEHERITKQREYYDKVQAEGDWEMAWGERKTLYDLALQYQTAIHNGELAGFYQEYFHQILSEESKRFKSQFFQYIDFELVYEYGQTFIKCPLYEHPTLLNIEFGVDLSAGTADGDDGVIAVVGSTWDRRKFVIDMIGGKFDHRDTLYSEVGDRYTYIEGERSNISKLGMMDEIIRQKNVYHPSKIKIGIAGEEVTFINEMRKLLYSKHDYTMLTARQQTKQGGTKHERIFNTLLTPFQSFLVYFRNGINEKLKHQLEFLTSAKHDDYADALEVAFYQMQIPSKMVLSDYEPKKEVYSKFYPPQRKSQFDWRVN